MRGCRGADPGEAPVPPRGLFVAGLRISLDPSQPRVGDAQHVGRLGIGTAGRECCRGLQQASLANRALTGAKGRYGPLGAAVSILAVEHVNAVEIAAIL